MASVKKIIEYWDNSFEELVDIIEELKKENRILEEEIENIIKEIEKK